MNTITFQKITWFDKEHQEGLPFHVSAQARETALKGSSGFYRNAPPLLLQWPGEHCFTPQECEDLSHTHSESYFITTARVRMNSHRI